MTLTDVTTLTNSFSALPDVGAPPAAVDLHDGGRPGLLQVQVQEPQLQDARLQLHAAVVPADVAL